MLARLCGAKRTKRESKDIKNTNDMALKWATKANENDRTLPRDCWIFYVAAHWWLWPPSVVRMYFLYEQWNKKPTTQTWGHMRTNMHLVLCEIVWIEIDVFPVIATTQKTTSRIKTWSRRKKKNEIINFAVYWQMTEKGFVAHTNSIIMKTGRKYLVVNWLLFSYSPHI